MNPTEQPDELNGWKEIASALGRCVRTAQHWAAIGMPVFKAIGGVRARRSELLPWVRNQFHHVSIKPIKRRKAA